MHRRAAMLAVAGAAAAAAAAAGAQREALAGEDTGTGRAFRPQDEAARRVVGIMYSVWHDGWAVQPHLTPEGLPRPQRPPYSAVPGVMHWWGVPALCGSAARVPATYRFSTPSGPNAALIDAHAKLLLDAGVDFIFLDLTNGEQAHIVNGARALLARYARLVRAGQDVPRVVVWCSGPGATRFVAETFMTRYDPRVFFRLDGKPLVLVRPATPAMHGGATALHAPEAYTYRTMWGLLRDTTAMWSFKNVELPYSGFRAPAGGGGVEQMPVAFASQRRHMHNDADPAMAAGRRGRENGRFFDECLAQVLREKPRIMTVCSWNEWTASNQLRSESQAAFTDLFGPEFSADCEPSVEHGTAYYDKLRDAVRRFKALA